MLDPWVAANEVGTLRGLLDGVRILDFTHMVAGPYMTLQLAYMGADVVKVESAARIDRWRVRYGDSDYEKSWAFGDHNKGKRDITINLKHPDAPALVKRLVRRCDAVTENFSAGVLERLGLDYPALAAVKPDLIVVRLPAMGLTGPRSRYVAWGPNIMAYTGFTHLWNHPRARIPVGSQTSYPDYAVGLHAALALVSALLWREESGCGTCLEIAQADATLSLLGPGMLQWLLDGVDPEPVGNTSTAFVPYGCYRCAGDDRWCVLAIRSDDEWRTFVRIAGEPPWARPEHATLLGRLRDRAAIDEGVSGFFADRDRDDAVRLLLGAGLAAAPVMAGGDLTLDEGLRQAGHLGEVDHPRLGRRLFPGPAMKVRGSPAAPLPRAPLLGEHTESILRELLPDATPEQREEWARDGLLR